MSESKGDYLHVSVKWIHTGNGEFPYTSIVENQVWLIRVNDFPEEAYIYTLIIDGQEMKHFSNWQYSRWEIVDKYGKRLELGELPSDEKI